MDIWVDAKLFRKRYTPAYGNVRVSLTAVRGFALSPAGPFRRLNASMVRAIIVDDHQLVLAGLARLLATPEGIQVVGEATNGLDAVELARSTRPNLALMDISMRGLNG